MTAPPEPPHAPPRPSPSPGDSGPGRIDLAPGAWCRESDVRFSFTRSSGPGGQNVNKVATRAELRLSVDAIEGLDDQARDRLRRFAGRRLTRQDELVIVSDTQRSQARNRRECLERLGHLVARAMVRPRRRVRKRPTRAMIERRLKSKREKAEKKQRRRWKPE